jgi:hypothetical protein
LGLDRLIDGTVFETLELDLGNRLLLMAAARLRQVGWAEKAADHLAPRMNGGG